MKKEVEHWKAGLRGLIHRQETSVRIFTRFVLSYILTPMQLIVLGMHRTGTSALTGLLNLMGAYIGPKRLCVAANDENKKGFWERRDVVDLNQETLRSCGADWYRVSGLNLNSLPDMERFRKRATGIIEEMDRHRPWVMKDPRLCLLFPLWKEFLQAPVCVHTYRSPIETAGSLQVRNGFPINAGIALWEKYNLDALAASQHLPRILIHYKDLLKSPVETVEKLYNGLCSLGVRGLKLPENAQVSSFVDSSLYRSRIEDSKHAGYLNSQQDKLYKGFENRSIFSWTNLPPLSAGGRDSLINLEVIDTIRTRNVALEERVEELDALLLVQNGRNRQLEKRVRELDASLLVQTGRSRQLNKRVEELDASLLAQTGRNRQLEKRVEELDASMLAQTGRNRQSEKRIEELDALLLAQTGRNRQLEKRVEELNEILIALEIERNALYNSITWKISNALVGAAGKLTPRKFRSAISGKDKRSL